MKKLALIFSAVQVLCLSGSCQLTLDAGAVWNYRFDSLTKTGLVSLFATNPIGVVTFSVDGATFQNGDKLGYEMFENSASETSLCSGLLSAGPPFTVVCQADSSWQDLQGAIRLTMLSGSLTVTGITLQVISPGASLSAYDVYASNFVPHCEPQLSASMSGSKVIISWPRSCTNDYVLQQAMMFSTLVSWEDVTNSVYAIGPNYYLTNDVAGTGQFFRLQGWETLFDGTSTAQFRGYQQSSFPGTNIWIVNTNGELESVVGGISVDLITTNQYSDFDLLWEWKTAVHGNSGVNYRATELHSRAEWSGPEYQLLDDPSYSVGAIQATAAVWSLVVPTNKVLLPAGQWNQCRIIVRSNHVEHWLNGNRVVSYELDSPAFTNAVSANSTFNQYPQFAKARAGYIALRHENTQTWFRKIKIRQLGP